jgi:hypothetical protein
MSIKKNNRLVPFKEIILFIVRIAQTGGAYGYHLCFEELKRILSGDALLLHGTRPSKALFIALVVRYLK